MPRLIETLNLKGNPFEHYVAEQEPDIADYAVKPPYFEAIDARAKNASSFILFGERGAGKSATRLTIFKELWRANASGYKVPFVVNLTDFSVAMSGRQLNKANEETLIREVAFIVLESLLTWLTSLEEDEREIYLEALNPDELALCYELLRDFYLSQSEQKRQRSVREAMALFNQAFLAKSKLWVEKRWELLARLTGNIIEAFVNRVTGAEANISQDVAALAGVQSTGFDSILAMRKLVQLVEIFDFSGLVILIDKVDETEATNNSAEKTAELIHPLLARVQLLEVASFSWIFFLWEKVKSIFESDKYPVRLDKIGHATVSWTDEFFALMLDRRLEFFSEGQIKLDGLFVPSMNVEEIRNELVRVCMRSPREIIRIMDVIIREHDVIHADKPEGMLLDDASVQAGINSYVKDRISSIYGERLLAQIFRLNRTTFSNKDVQLTFKVGAQSARTRIQSWENAGIIRFSGTRAAEGVQGGKPANEYAIIDARIERIMQRQLISYNEPIIADPEFDPASV